MALCVLLGVRSPPSPSRDPPSVVSLIGCAETNFAVRLARALATHRLLLKVPVPIVEILGISMTTDLSLQKRGCHHGFGDVASTEIVTPSERVRLIRTLSAYSFMVNGSLPPAGRRGDGSSERTIADVAIISYSQNQKCVCAVRLLVAGDRNNPSGWKLKKPTIPRSSGALGRTRMGHTISKP
jgi:hypothetical protein